MSSPPTSRNHAAGPRPSVIHRLDATDTGRISPDHPRRRRRRPGHQPTTGPDVRTISTSTAPFPTTAPGVPSDPCRRPTPFESGLAAVARQDVHIERVWPMRSPSTGSLGESSSAYFQSERRGTPPASIVPVEGLRMSQTFDHEPVMTTEVVELLSPVPPGLVVDATLGGGGHAAALLRANPGITILGIDRDPLAVAAATEALAPFGSRASSPPVPVRRAGRGRRRAAGRARAVRPTGPGSAGSCSTSGSARRNWTWPGEGSPTGAMPSST